MIEQRKHPKHPRPILPSQSGGIMERFATQINREHFKIHVPELFSVTSVWSSLKCVIDVRDQDDHWNNMNNDDLIILI